MLNLKEVTTLLKCNGVNATAKKLKVKKAEIHNLLRDNSLEYIDGEVKPIELKNNTITKVIQEDPAKKEVSATIDTQINKKNNNNKSTQKVIQKYNKDIDKIRELIELIDPIKEVIQEYNKNKNIVEVKPVELRVKNITEVKQKLFKIDVDVLNKWEQFVKDNKQYKVQNLISLALEEFIDKYSKKS